MTDRIDTAPATRRQPRLVLPVVLIATFLMPMGISGTAIALPRIAAELGSSPALLQWVVNGFNIAFALFTLVWGVLSDRIGYRATFRAGVALVLIAALGSAWAQDLVLLDVTRVVSGIGGAAVLTGASAILSNTYTGAARGRIFAVFGTVIGLGLAVGPTVSGVLISWFDWRGVFVAHAVALALALLGTAALPFMRHQRDPGRKVVDFSLLRNPHFLALCLVPVSGAIGFVTLLTYLPVALSGIASLSAGLSGLVMLPLTIPVLVGPVLAARLIHTLPRVTSMTMIYASLACLILGGLGMLLLTPGVSIWWVVVPLVLAGFGFGLPLGLVDGEALATVPPHSSGTAAGVLNFVRLGSEAVFVALYASGIAWLVGLSIPDAAAAQATAAGHPGHAAAYADAFHLVLVGMVVLVSVTTVAIALLHRARVGAAAATASAAAAAAAAAAASAAAAAADIPTAAAWSAPAPGCRG